MTGMDLPNSTAQVAYELRRSYSLTSVSPVFRLTSFQIQYSRILPLARPGNTNSPPLEFRVRSMLRTGCGISMIRGPNLEVVVNLSLKLFE